MNLVELVNLLRNPQRPIDEARYHTFVEEFERMISHPGGSDLLFYPEYWGIDSEATAEEIARIATSWRPFVGAARVTNVQKHPQRPDLYCYMVQIPNRLLTQVVSPMILGVSDVCAVAFSGVVLPNGKVSAHRFVDRAYTAGDILGTTNADVGSELSANEFSVEGLPIV